MSKTLFIRRLKDGDQFEFKGAELIIEGSRNDDNNFELTFKDDKGSHGVFVFCTLAVSKNLSKLKKFGLSLSNIKIAALLDKFIAEGKAFNLDETQSHTSKTKNVMKEYKEPVLTSKTHDSNNTRIKKLIGGTLEELYDRFPWLEKAKIKNAVIKMTSDSLEWKQLIWINGTWNNGTWKNGTWKNGIWKNGTWNEGLWINGTWKNGLWKKGLWREGTWENGTWINGTWKSGIWKNGSWKDGTWINGIWINGSWTDGLWENGTWKKGKWIKGTWIKGIGKNKNRKNKKLYL